MAESNVDKSAPFDPYGILSLPDPTEEEKKEEDLELVVRPVDCAATYELTKQQFAVRQRIGKRDAKKIYTIALEESPKLAHLCLTHPFYLFYTSPNSVSKYRVFGYFKLTNGEFRTEAVSASLSIHNEVVGGVPLKDVVALEEWNSDHHSFLKQVKYKDLFLDPLGYANMISLIN